jgi:NADH dehydrogenase (ubiquinone) 1 alpha subcomplex subunit 8
MVVTAQTHLPSDEELTVQEINLSSPALRAASFHVGKFCEKENNVSIKLIIFLQLFF